MSVVVFTPGQSDFGFTENGTDYNFLHVDSLVTEDPEQVRLTRGANATDKVGIHYVEGSKEPKSVTISIPGVDTDILDLLKSIHKERRRVDVWAIDRVMGHSKYGKSAVLCQEPRQLTIDETPESMTVQLRFETFDLQDKVKGA